MRVPVFCDRHLPGCSKLRGIDARGMPRVSFHKVPMLANCFSHLKIQHLLCQNKEVVSDAMIVLLEETEPCFRAGPIILSL
jgi:hypothetical protein